VRIHPVALLAALAASAALALAGCGSDSTDAAADASTAAVAASTAPAQSTATTAEAADFGPPVELKALNKEPIEVTLLQIADPATSDNPSLQPEAGKRYLAAELRIDNTGAQPYDDTPANGAAVIDTSDAEWDASIFDPIEPGFGSLTIAPGDGRTGWITFEVPEGAVLRTLQFVTDSGFGSETEWALP